MSQKILGESLVIRQLHDLIAKVAASKTNVLLVGESGTGKELIARSLHESGFLKGKPFVAVNCGAIPETLIESELFGHKKGSFTGAIAEKIGLFEVANSGTIFLDEVGELPLSMQVKLLRVIQDRSLRRVGGVEDIKVDIRIIAATNRDLETSIQQGAFREDLYYRLNVIQIKAPPLRHRKEDIKILAQHFLEKLNQRFGAKISGFQTNVITTLEAYQWPGNVRELENVIERAFTLENGKKITLSSLPPTLVAQVSLENTKEEKFEQKLQRANPVATADPTPLLNWPVDLDKILNNLERVYIISAIQQAGGVKKKAGDLLGITFRSLRYRLKKLKIGSTTKA